MKERIIISRKWKSPQIEAFADVSEIGARIDIDAFLDALVEEIGNPTTLVTKAGLRARLASAKDAVLKEMKDATRFVV